MEISRGRAEERESRELYEVADQDWPLYWLIRLEATSQALQVMNPALETSRCSLSEIHFIKLAGKLISKSIDTVFTKSLSLSFSRRSFYKLLGQRSASLLILFTIYGHICHVTRNCHYDYIVSWKCSWFMNILRASLTTPQHAHQTRDARVCYWIS